MSLLTTEKSRVLRTAALGTGGLLLLSLGFAGASAAPSDGEFAVKAVDQKNVEVFALRGDPSLEAAPGDGGGTVEPPADATLYTMTCGPASLPVTESMRELSNSNAETFASSGALDGATPHADGWSLLVADNKLGDPIPTAKPNSLMLIGANPTRVTGSVVESATGCTYSMADKTKPGLNHYTHVVSTGSYTEGRTVIVSGTPTYIQILKNGASTTVSRFVPPASGSDLSYVAKSATLPYYLEIAASFTQTAVALPSTTDGYNIVQSRAYADGSGWIRFKQAAGPVDSNAATLLPLAKRQAGPAYAEYNAAGLLTKFTYINGSGAEVSSPASPSTFSVADYNALTGQNWNGNIPKPSDFNITVPFQPTAPTS